MNNCSDTGWPKLSHFIEAVLIPQTARSSPISTFSHEELYRIVYTLSTFKGLRPRLRKDLFTLISTLLDRQYRHLYECLPSSVPVSVPVSPYVSSSVSSTSSTNATSLSLYEWTCLFNEYMVVDLRGSNLIRDVFLYFVMLFSIYLYISSLSLSLSLSLYIYIYQIIYI
jgi:hypothetical protein